MQGIDVRRASDRLVTETEWLVSRHSFSYGAAYSEGNTSFGMLLAHNDDLLTPGTGFDDHPHRGLEIVTWVLSGELIHGDASGRVEHLGAGDVQVFGAGRGSTHSEYAGVSAHGDARTHYVQMWIAPDPDAATEPAYQRGHIDDAPDRFVPVVSGGSALTIRQPAATFSVCALQAGAQVPVPDAPYLHLFVAAGSVDLSTPDGRVRLDVGDAVRATEARDLTVSSVGNALLGAWQMANSLL